MFEVILVTLVIGFMCSGCSHTVVNKRCAKVDSSEYVERADQSICDTLWFWE